MAKELKILDCTLRDGGYCNNWQFGHENIKYMIRQLMAAGIDLIECGLLTERLEATSENSIFSSVLQVEEYVQTKPENTSLLLLMNYGEYTADWLPPRSASVVDGIRVAFHKKELYEALELCYKIKEKGYLIYPQPMVTNLYSPQELELLLQLSNSLQPTALYIVDSFGSMTKDDVERLFGLYDAKLDRNISIGFHSHNNLMLSLSHSLLLIQKQNERTLLIDSSILGMGRGAGNLHTEELISSLKAPTGYNVAPLYAIIDQVLEKLKEEHPWGYSELYYLSAIHHCHPNYTLYLMKNGITNSSDVNRIFLEMAVCKKSIYDEDYIQKQIQTWREQKT